MSKNYESFLSNKLGVDVPTGIADPPELAGHLFPFQSDLVRWALKRGRAAIFADCGLGKGPMALEWAHHVSAHTGRPVIIVAPLAVAQQFVREGQKFGRPVTYARDRSDLSGNIIVTNYERLDRFDPSVFGGVVLDESSILKHHDAKTRIAIIESFRDMPFRLSCTATPSPNDIRELGGQAEFLGVAKEQEMLARFFVHDGEKSSGNGWRLKGHAKRVFWRWVCTWAAMVRKPSDLGYDDGAFILPPLNRHQHTVANDIRDAWASGSLFIEEAKGLAGRRSARKSSLADRVATAAAMVNASDEQWIVWCGLNAEGDDLEKSIPDAVQVSGSDSPETKEKSLLEFMDGSARVLISKPSICAFGLNLQQCRNQVFVGLSDSFEDLYQAVRRSYRFGQSRAVNIHIVTSEAEGSVVANVERKEKDAAAMADAMVAEMREMMRAEIRGAKHETDEYKPTVEMRIPEWLSNNARAA
jgi:hypothetical protein